MQPVAGGGGRAHIHFNTVRIEAILTNPNSQLPEVVRLAWMLSQLNLDLPDYQGTLTRDRTEVVGALALLPVVLSAGEEVELVRNDLATLVAAINGWECLDRADLKEKDLNEIANNLLVWWETYQSARPRWSVALAALDRMLV